MTCAVSDTGPLISAFQSKSFSLLTKIFPEIYTSTACLNELKRHGWEEEVNTFESYLKIVNLTPKEQVRAEIFAKQIAKHPDSYEPVPVNHIGESEIIVLAYRSEFQRSIILLDELAARAIAKKAGLKLSGFPGI